MKFYNVEVHPFVITTIIRHYHNTLEFCVCKLVCFQMIKGKKSKYLNMIAYFFDNNTKQYLSIKSSLSLCGGKESTPQRSQSLTTLMSLIAQVDLSTCLTPNEFWSWILLPGYSVSQKFAVEGSIHRGLFRRCSTTSALAQNDVRWCRKLNSISLRYNMIVVWNAFICLPALALSQPQQSAPSLNSGSALVHHVMISFQLRSLPY